MSKTSGRRIYLDNESKEIMDNLRYHIFKGLTLVEIFSICLVKGRQQGYKSPLSNKKSIIREETLNNSNLPYLMKAVAVEETGNLDILNDKNEYFTICEEYAKTGLIYLKSQIFENEEDLLNSLELEALEFFDENVI